MQVPSINSSLFAFLTLGINPLTNHTLSTPSLIAVLFAIGLAGILLFFNRALSDFFGGLFDWLTKAERNYMQPAEEAVAPKFNFDTTPVRTVMVEVRSPATEAALPSFRSFAASVRAAELPKIVLPSIKLPTKRLSNEYGAFLDKLRSRLHSPETSSSDQEALDEVLEEQSYSMDLAPEMAEVLAIFENLALESALSEPLEAEIVEPVTPKEPNVLLTRIRDGVQNIEYAFGLTKQRTRSNVLRASRKANQYGAATSREAQSAVRTISLAISRAAKKTTRMTYQSILLLALGVLLAVDKTLHALTVTVRAAGNASSFAYKKTMRSMMLAAVAITLGMFAVGRGINTAARTVGHDIAIFCRGIYWLLSMGAMVAFLASGYTLFVFSLIAFMVWEFCEPYARKMDKWLGDSFGDDEGLTEMAKIGHEMNRTATQWYRELRKIKHGIYR